MAAFGSVATANDSDGTVTVTKPSGLAAGDLMVAFCSEYGLSGAFQTPSGWTLIDTQAGSTNALVHVFAKIASAGDAAASDFSFVHDAAGKTEVVLYRITGTLTSTANIYTFSSVTGSEPVADTLRFSTGVTPIVANSLLIMYMMVACSDSDNNAVSNYALQTSSPTWTEQADFQDNGASNSVKIASATATRTQTTDTGYFQAEVGAGEIVPGECVGILLAIADTSNGTATPTVITMSSSVQSSTPSGGATVTASVITTTTTVNSPTATGGTNDALWKNTDKPSAGSINNTDKP